MTDPKVVTIDEDLTAIQEITIPTGDPALLERAATLRKQAINRELTCSPIDTALGFFDLEDVGRSLQISNWSVLQHVEILTDIARTSHSDRIRMIAMDKITNMAREAAITTGRIQRTTVHATTEQDGKRVTAEKQTMALVREGLTQEFVDDRDVKSKPTEEIPTQGDRGSEQVQASLGHRPPQRNEFIGGVCRADTSHVERRPTTPFEHETEGGGNPADEHPQP
jgi:hypothetical protein